MIDPMKRFTQTLLNVLRLVPGSEIWIIECVTLLVRHDSVLQNVILSPLTRFGGLSVGFAAELVQQADELLCCKGSTWPARCAAFSRWVAFPY